MKKVFLIIMFLLIIPIKVSAICPYEEKVRLNNIAKNLDLTYDYYYVDNKEKKIRPYVYIGGEDHVDIRSIYVWFKAEGGRRLRSERGKVPLYRFDG